MQPKFVYKQGVRIIKGFYRGQTGNIVGYNFGNGRYLLKGWVEEQYLTEDELEAWEAPHVKVYPWYVRPLVALGIVLVGVVIGKYIL